jgi:hypothetical protein
MGEVDKPLKALKVNPQFIRLFLETCFQSLLWMISWLPDLSILPTELKQLHIKAPAESKSLFMANRQIANARIDFA